MNRVFGALLVIASVAAPQVADTRETVKNGTVDLSVPESPAFAVLGLTPDTVVRPTTPRAFASALLNGVDPNGNFQTGVAIDVAPFLMLAGRTLTLQQYQQSYAKRVFTRMQWSLATTKGASENDKSVRLSTGLHFTFWDEGDFRGNLAFQKELNELDLTARKNLAARGIIMPSLLEPEKMSAFLQLRDEEVERLIAPVYEKWRKRNWNRSGWALGAAPSWISTTGTTESFKWNGAALWTSLAYGFEGITGLEDTSQIIVHARYRNNDRVPVPDSDSEFYVQNSSLLGARVRMGQADTQGSFEVVYLRAEPRDLPVDQFLRLSVSAERRLSRNVWLQFGVGGESGQRDNRNHMFVLTSLKWGIAER